MIRTIEILVSPTGQTKVETKGFTGPTCRAASQFIEGALGQRTAENLTVDFYEAGSTGRTIEEKQA